MTPQDPDANPLYDKDGNAFTDAYIDFIEEQQYLRMPEQKLVNNLAIELKNLGFNDIPRKEIERIVILEQPSYLCQHKVMYGDDLMTYLISIQKGANDYHLKSYNAILRKPLEIPDISIDGIDVRALDKKMGKVDWDNEPCERLWRFIHITDKDYARNHPLEKMLSDVWQIERAGKFGKEISERLQFKHWGNERMDFNMLVDNFYPLQNRYETWADLHVSPDLSFDKDEAYKLLNGKAIYKLQGIIKLVPPETKNGSACLVEKHTNDGLYLQNIKGGFQHLPINKQIKSPIMIKENLEYLQKNVKYMGFEDKLKDAIARNMEQGVPDFTLKTDALFNNKKIEAELSFRRSDNSDMYFFNSYKASMGQGDEARSQTFYIDKGKGITFKEAFNLLEGRAVYKELTNQEHQKYNAWVQLDFDKMDKHHNYELKRFTEGYGYDMDKALNALPIKELKVEDSANKLLASLEKGNVQSVTMQRNGGEEKMFIEAAPQWKTVNIYDGQMKPLGKEQKQELAQGKQQSPAQNDDSLLEKKRVSNKKGMSVT